MFNNSNLSVIAFANGFTLWHYYGSDVNSSDIDENYFSQIYTLCNVGDKMMMNLRDCYQEVIITKITDTFKNHKVFFKVLLRLDYEVSNEHE